MCGLGMIHWRGEAVAMKVITGSLRKASQALGEGTAACPRQWAASVLSSCGWEESLRRGGARTQASAVLLHLMCYFVTVGNDDPLCDSVTGFSRLK